MSEMSKAERFAQRYDDLKAATPERRKAYMERHKEAGTWDRVKEAIKAEKARRLNATKEGEPIVGVLDRLKLRNFSGGTDDRKAYLEKNYPDYEFRVIDDDVVGRKRGETQYRPAVERRSTGPAFSDPKEMLLDVLDSGYDVASGVAEAIPTAAAATGAFAAGGPLAAYAAGMGTAGALGAASEGARQSIGQALGVHGDYKGGDIATAGAVSAVMPGVFGTGAGAGKGALDKIANSKTVTDSVKLLPDKMKPDILVGADKSANLVDTPVEQMRDNVIRSMRQGNDLAESNWKKIYSAKQKAAEEYVAKQGGIVGVGLQKSGRAATNAMGRMMGRKSWETERAIENLDSITRMAEEANKDPAFVQDKLVGAVSKINRKLEQNEKNLSAAMENEGILARDTQVDVAPAFAEIREFVLDAESNTDLAFRQQDAEAISKYFNPLFRKQYEVETPFSQPIKQRFETVETPFSQPIKQNFETVETPLSQPIRPLYETTDVPYQNFKPKYKDGEPDVSIKSTAQYHYTPIKGKQGLYEKNLQGYTLSPKYTKTEKVRDGSFQSPMKYKPVKEYKGVYASGPMKYDKTQEFKGVIPGQMKMQKSKEFRGVVPGPVKTIKEKIKVDTTPDTMSYEDALQFSKRLRAASKQMSTNEGGNPAQSQAAKDIALHLRRTAQKIDSQIDTAILKNAAKTARNSADVDKRADLVSKWAQVKDARRKLGFDDLDFGPSGDKVPDAESVNTAINNLINYRDVRNSASSSMYRDLDNKFGLGIEDTFDKIYSGTLLHDPSDFGMTGATFGAKEPESSAIQQAVGLGIGIPMSVLGYAIPKALGTTFGDSGGAASTALSLAGLHYGRKAGLDMGKALHSKPAYRSMLKASNSGRKAHRWADERNLPLMAGQISGNIGDDDGAQAQAQAQYNELRRLIMEAKGE